METVMKICVVLFFLGIGHTNDSNPKIYHHGDDAIVLIDKLQTDGNKDLDIFFSGFASKLHFTHVMLYLPNMNHDDYKHVSKNYTDRIKNITMNNGSLSFLLLNINFMDSGNYTVFEGSWEKGKQSILVTRLRLNGQVDEPMILSFICNNTNTSSIKFQMPTAFRIYNVAQRNCIYVINQHMNRTESCGLNETNFYLTVRKFTWLDKGNYIAWDDKGFLLDSIFVDMPEDNSASSQQSTNSSPSSAEEHAKWLLVSSVVVVLVAACLVIIAVRKHRQRKVPKTTTNNVAYRNGRQTTVNSSRNERQDFEESPSPEESRIISTTINNADNLTDFMHNRGQGKVKLNEKHNCARWLDSAKSPIRTTSKLQIQSTLTLGEKHLSKTDHGYNCVNKSVQLKTESRSDEPYLSSTESIAGPSFEYDYVVQRSYMKLRPPAPDPVVTKENKGQVMIVDSILWYKKVHMKSSSRADPSNLYTKVNKKRNMETHCTDSSAEHGSRDFINELTPPVSFELEDAADLKGQSELQSLNYDLALNVCDDSSAREREHLRSQSNGVLNGDLMAKSSVRRSSGSSCRTLMNEDCYDSI